MTLLVAWSGSAQPFLPPSGHYYAIENLARHVVELRGRSDSDEFALPEDVILAPNTPYRLTLLQAATLNIGFLEFITPASGRRIELPVIFYWPDESPDTDNDGLRDDGEAIVGTDPNRPDTDNDGIPDGSEIRQVLDPLDGLNVRTGIVQTTQTPGPAVDVWAGDDFVVTAEGAAGISVFNAYNGLNPIIIAHVPTPGAAVRVTGARNFLAVAASEAGLLVVDLSSPAAAAIRHQIALGRAQAVAAEVDVAYAGFSSGLIVAVDVPTGTVLNRVSLSGSIQDLAIAGGFLYALTDDRLFALPLGEIDLAPVGSAVSPFFSTPNRRLFVGGGIAYAVHGKGYNTFDLTDPTQPTLLSTTNTTQFGWKQIVVNGSGLGLAATGPNFSDDGPHDISLYDVSDPRRNNILITTFPTPGIARAVTLFNGLAYVADDTRGLEVINYLAYDNQGKPPTISLQGSIVSDAPQAEAGKGIRLEARVSDDVQVRNVEFHLDGVRFVTDGSFPFETRLVTPLLTSGRTNFTIRAKATDTGGNVAWTEPLVVTLVADATPPVVTRVVPAANAIVAQANAVAAYFNEPMDAATLTPATVQLQFAGPDSVLDTPDDTIVTNGTIAYRETQQGAVLSFGSDLAGGLYRGRVAPPIADLSSNTLARPTTWQFWVTNDLDTDGDGVPDVLERALGFDPSRPDTDGNGVPDGDEDLDGDGLRTAWELRYGFDPRVRDSDGNGTGDGEEDPDFDGLLNRQEQLAGTDPRAADTDRDGWTDEAEVTAGSDPLVNASHPKLFAWVQPEAEVVLPYPGDAPRAQDATVVAVPPVEVNLPVTGIAPGEFDLTSVARPSVRILLPVLGSERGRTDGIGIAQPPVDILLPAPTEIHGSSVSVTIAQPPVEVGFSGSESGPTSLSKSRNGINN